MWNTFKIKKYGVALYNYSGENRHGLAINVGETVCVQELCNDWYRGFLIRNKNEKGIFPASHIHIKECRIDKDGAHETLTPIEDSIAVEVAYTLREWATVWKRLYVEQDFRMFTSMRRLMMDLMEWRRQLVTGKLTQDQCLDLKARITNKIDWGNRKLGLDLVPRTDSDQVDAERISPVELFNIHVTSSEQSKSASAHMHRKVSIAPIAPTVEHHLYVNIKSYGVNVGDESEISVSLYDNRAQQSFSERYVVRYTKHGFPVNIDRGANCPCLFTDLGSEDLLRDVYLVVHVYRIGPMVQSDSKKPIKSTYKRPLGCAAMSIKEILIGNIGMEGEPPEFNMKVYSYNNEPEFPQLLEHIIRKVGSKLNMASAQMHLEGDRSTFAEGVVVQMTVLHGNMSQAKKEHPILFSKGLPYARKLGFPDIIMPGDLRNDLYLTLVRGEFERGSKTAGKNIEVRVVVLDSEGQIQDAIIQGAGETNASEYRTAVFYHNNNPRWNETIKLSLPIEKFKGAHFRIEFRHCSTRDKAEKKLFGFAFAKLTAPDGTVITDGVRELFFYKCEEVNKLQMCKLYMGLPSSPAEIQSDGPSTPGNSSYKRSDRESVYISTLLCSTKLTQNFDLIGLLNWRDQPKKLTENLTKLLSIDGEEVVKFLHDILESLFNMFSEETYNVNTQLVFQALVHICDLLEAKKFENFKSVIDAYIGSHFAFPLVYRILLQQITDHVNKLLTTEAEEVEKNLVHCKVLEPIFKFVVKSRQLYSSHFGKGDEADFKALLKTFFQAIGNVIAIHFEVVTRPQCILLTNSVGLWEILLKLLPPSELTEYLVAIINRIPKEHATEMTKAKLRAIHTLVVSDLFKKMECRTMLLPLCLAQLKHHMVQRQELRLCGKILGEILKELHANKDQGEATRVREDLRPISTAMLDLTVQTMLTLSNPSHSGQTPSTPQLFDTGRSMLNIPFVSDTPNYRLIAGQLVCCLVALLRLMDEGHYQAVLNSYKDNKPLKVFLSSVWTIFGELVKHDIFPPDWAVMRMVTNSTLLVSAQHFSEVLSKKFLDGPSFDKQLWSQYFSFAVAFLTQPSLQLEQHTETKRDKTFNKYGDLRVRMGYEIKFMWESLGSRRLHFIPALVGPFLEATMVPVAELRKLVMPVFFDMMQCEQEAKGNFKSVENELIDKLDILISENKGDDEYKQVFNTVLLDKMQECPSWQQNGVAFIQSITRLMERLLDYRRLQEGEVNIGKRMTCTVNLLNFYKDEVKREEMYLRYIYKLRDLHLSCKNFTEAGYTLLVHAQQLGWTDEFLQKDHEHPGQHEWQRKERLYMQIIHYFDQGKAWENGVPLCKALGSFYETKLYNFTKLSEILKTQARFYDNILQQLRADPEYFRVGFYGQGFPPFLRNKMFIYRGDDYERLASFTSRLSSEFHKAQLLKNNNPATESIKLQDGMYLQICSVRPVPDKTNQVFEAANVPEQVLQFHRANHVDTFQFDRPFHRGDKDKENEFKTLCIERTTLKTVCKLPGILRWFEVEQMEVAVLTPIETAIDSLLTVNDELQKLIRTYSADSAQNLNPLTMRLNGTIDAAVSGGISRYQEAFFTNEYAEDNPEEAIHVDMLKWQLAHQMTLLDQALALHGKLASIEVQPLHQRLVDCFKKMKQGIRDSGMIVAATVENPDSDVEVRMEEWVNEGSPDMQRLVLASRKLSISEERPCSTGSSKSSLTPTPPGSNRSSGFYGEVPSDHSSSDSAQSQDYCHLYQTPRRIQSFIPTYTPLPSRINNNTYDVLPHADRPQSVALIKSTDFSSLQGSGINQRTSSDISIELSSKRERLSSAPSSLSVDSGLSSNRSRTSSPAGRFSDRPPDIPPRKTSVVSFEDHSETSEKETRRKSTGVKVSPPSLEEFTAANCIENSGNKDKTKVPPRVAPKPAIKRSSSSPSVTKPLPSPLSTPSPSPEAKSVSSNPSSRSTTPSSTSITPPYGSRGQHPPILEEHETLQDDCLNTNNINNGTHSPVNMRHPPSTEERPQSGERPTPKPRKPSVKS